MYSCEMVFAIFCSYFIDIDIGYGCIVFSCIVEIILLLLLHDCYDSLDLLQQRDRTARKSVADRNDGVRVGAGSHPDLDPVLRGRGDLPGVVDLGASGDQNNGGGSH